MYFKSLTVKDYYIFVIFSLITDRYCLEYAVFKIYFWRLRQITRPYLTHQGNGLKPCPSGRLYIVLVELRAITKLL